MSKTKAPSIKELYRQWRGGDAEAGQQMAQRVADWFYAVATSRLGEAGGSQPCERACARFGEGVVKVEDARHLVKWAHEIIQEELAKEGGRRNDGDEATHYTGGQAPKGLLVRARGHLPAEVRLLEACYTGRDDEVDELAKPLGGMPIGVLKARYRVKQWLRDNAKVPVEVAPDEPVLDRAPLPLYESGRMASVDEEHRFEQWMLTDLDLCKDIAEFAQFALALRGGLPAGGERDQGAPRSESRDVPASSAGSGAGVAAAGGVAMVGIIGVGLVILAVIAAGLYFFMG